jgi:MFS transporter, ACS family, hexuronate transporter
MPVRARWTVCGLLLAATTLNYMDRVALNQLVNPILREFQLTSYDYAILESRFDIAFAIGTLITGWLVDRINVRFVYPVMVLGWSLAGFCTGYADTFQMLLLCRVALGLFEAGNWPCGIRTTRTVLPPDERSFGNALFQSGTAIGAIVTPMVVLASLNVYGKDTPGVWAVPFRIIGALGLVWVLGWLMLAPRTLFPAPEPVQSAGPPFWSVFGDSRFWVLIVVILGVNIGWHTIRVWMPLLLQRQYGFDDVGVQKVGIAYYLAADAGSWTVGLATLVLARKGYDMHAIRFGSFAVCTVILAAAAVMLLEFGHQAATIILCVMGFAALGLFPTYFALSQELSARHQGKVTGTLGFINAMVMSQVKPAQGEYVSTGGGYDTLIAMGTLPAAIALLTLWLYWRPRKGTG